MARFSCLRGFILSISLTLFIISSSSVFAEVGIPSPKSKKNSGMTETVVSSASSISQAMSSSVWMQNFGTTYPDGTQAYRAKGVVGAAATQGPVVGAIIGIGKKAVDGLNIDHVVNSLTDPQGNKNSVKQFSRALKKDQGFVYVVILDTQQDDGFFGFVSGVESIKLLTKAKIKRGVTHTFKISALANKRIATAIKGYAPNGAPVARAMFLTDPNVGMVILGQSIGNTAEALAIAAIPGIAQASFYKASSFEATNQLLQIQDFRHADSWAYGISSK